ncbi:ras-like protein [Anaeramoeba ignava]|uniref:Ras-like protein n=1 Tax=Anaeramoeba ignava TaxID=1746090 RepID=A0A9Q0LPC8_ANAIG|nr:ras-like protein [Anaeramoeba ignava]
MPNFKIVIVGGGGVGKSALTIQFVHSKFIEVYEATIEDSYRRQVEIDNEVHILDILDTAGQEEYAVIRDTHLRSGDGFLVVFSITSRESFEEIPKFVDQIHKAKENDKIPVVLVGNKSDLEKQRQVPTKDAQKYAKSIKCQYVETSAKLRVNVEEIFFMIAREIQGSGGGLSNTRDRPRPKKKRCILL